MEVLKKGSYVHIYEETLKMANEVREKTGVNVYITVGPYPVDYLLFRQKLGREKALHLMMRGMEEAAEFYQNHDICIGLGEIGRPHFEVEEEVTRDSNSILIYGMECARDVGAPVILHTESTTPDTCKELVRMGKKVGLDAEKIVKHFSPPLILPEENYGLIPSVLATRKNLETSIKKGSRFMMETDYIDDPKRPGAVLGPKTVPRQTRKLLENGLMDEEQAYRIHKDIPEKIYNISLDV